jgi:hypothetical protein
MAYAFRQPTSAFLNWQAYQEGMEVVFAFQWLEVGDGDTAT